MGDQHELLEGSFLSPRNDVEVGDFQSALLNKAFESESVKNIAITGPVGCGKSSFIKSYEAAYGKRFAYLSLADFDYRNVDKGKDAEESECVKSLNALERKIIDQLSVVNNSNSSIKWVKTEYPSAKVSFNARALAMAFVAFLVVTVIALALCVQVVSHPFAGESSAYPIGITAALLVLLIVGLSVWYVKSGCPPIVKSLSLEGVRAEVESDVKSCSYFDEHLSFIIELFEAREEDAFVFEDLDRLSQSEILGQLRELNLTLNLARGSAIKPIRFVYCLADDVLLGESRTKFFDLMIPVVPIVDGYNSYGRIVEQLSGFPGDLSNQLLLNTAFYIDDYRLLKSIVTDYCVYADELNAQKQTCFDYSKLFAMMAIKNVAPSVFIDLERRRGALYKYLKDLSGENVDPVFLRPHGFKKILDPYCKTSFSESGFPDGYIENVVEFLSYLIKSGFVDEGYYFYIARPDSKRLSDRDRAWLMMARNGSSNYQWALDAPESVLEYLHDYEFLKPSTMNLSLAEYMSTSCSTENQAFKNMIECAFGEASDFGSLAVSRLPRFPYAVINRTQGFLLSEHEFDKSLFILSVVSGSLLERRPFAGYAECEYGHDGLFELDADNNGAISRVFSDFAGLYSTEQIVLFEKSFPSVVNDIVEALDTFGDKAVTLGEDASRELILALLNSGSYLQTEDNIRVALECETGCAICDGSVLDSAFAMPDSLTWKNIESDPDSFVTEYLNTSSSVTCSSQTFIHLANSEMSSDSRKRLAKSYHGDIASLVDVKDSSVWRILLQNATVSSTISNALSYLEVVGPTGDWVAFVNGFEGFSLKKSDCSEASLSVVKAQINNFNSLDDDKFKSFLGLLDAYSISNIPSNLSDEKIRLMFDMRIPVLSRHSLSVMHDKYAGGFCLPYIEGDIDAYMSCVAYTSPSDEELSAVLALSCVHTKDYRASLVNMLRSRIALNADYDDETAQVLLDRGRLSSSGVAAAFERFGKSDSLDKTLVGYAASLSVNGLIELNVDRRIVVEVIRCSSFRKRLDIFGKLTDWEWSELVEALHAFDLGDLDSILDKRHPKVDKLSDETRQVVSLLNRMGYATISSDGRVYIARSKRHR